MITKEDIETIIISIGKNREKDPYLSEAQFQFELAWELQKACSNFDIKKILLEYTSCIMTAHNNKRKRFESDIIVIFNDSKYLVIELKYKTSKATINGIELISQGGQPGTKYDYLWDIRRIELLKNKPENDNDGNKYSYTLNNYECIGGYAIFLTNDTSYFDGKEKEKDSAYNFRLEADREIKSSSPLEWTCKNKKDWMKTRPSFKFCDSHTLSNWCTFSKYTDPSSNSEREFKYLITKI